MASPQRLSDGDTVVYEAGVFFEAGGTGQDSDIVVELWKVFVLIRLCSYCYSAYVSALLFISFFLFLLLILFFVLFFVLFLFVF